MAVKYSFITPVQIKVNSILGRFHQYIWVTLLQKKGYRCCCPSKHKYFISHDVTFFESQAFYPSNSLQGGTNRSEGNFWDREDNVSHWDYLKSISSSNSPSNPPPISLPISPLSDPLIVSSFVESIPPLSGPVEPIFPPPASTHNVPSTPQLDHTPSDQPEPINQFSSSNPVPSSRGEINN